MARYSTSLENGSLSYTCNGRGGATPIVDGRYSFNVAPAALPCLLEVSVLQTSGDKDTWRSIAHQASATSPAPIVPANVNILSTMVANAVAGASNGAVNASGLKNLALTGSATLTERLTTAYKQVNDAINPHFSRGGQWVEGSLSMASGDLSNLADLIAKMNSRNANYIEMLDSFAFNAPHTGYPNVHAAGRTKMLRPPSTLLYPSTAQCASLRLDHEYHVFVPKTDSSLERQLRRWKFELMPSGTSYDINEIRVREILSDGTINLITLKQTGNGSCEYKDRSGSNPPTHHVVVSPSGVLAGFAQTSGWGTTSMVGIPAVSEHAVSELSTALTTTAGWTGAGVYFDDSARKYYGRVEQMVVGTNGSITSHTNCGQNNWSLGSCPTVSGETITKRANTTNLFDVTRSATVERVIGMYRSASGSPLLVVLDKNGGLMLFGYAGELARPPVGEKHNGWMLTAGSEARFTASNDVTGWSKTVSTHPSDTQAVWNYQQTGGSTSNAVLSYGNYTGFAERSTNSPWAYSRDLVLPGHGVTVHVEGYSGGSTTAGKRMQLSVLRWAPFSN